MKRREKEEAEVSTAQQLTGSLKNFTIPRKKRTSGEVLLENCPEESRDYSLIQSKLRDSRLDTRKDEANTWLWKDVRLVHNDELLKKFSEKRAEMRAKGRHGTEMEERFCFLVASEQVTAHIYRDGLRVDSSVQHALGKPSHGVYLFRHVDVALKSATSTMSATNLLIFKVLYGKVKKIAPNLKWNKSPDPVVGFDCHMLKDGVSPRDPLHQQTLGSSVFLFDFNEKQELNERPRQCLPFAVVSFVSAILTPPLKLPLLPSPADPSHAEHFQAHTVSQRRAKGNHSTITFKHFGPPQSSGAQYLFQNTQTLHPHQHWIPVSQTSESSSCSVLHHTTVSQHLLGEDASLQQSTAATQGTSDKCDMIPNVSTIVYSSRSVRDPRLSRRETNQQINCSEGAYSASCDDRSQPAPQNQEANYGFGMAGTDSAPKEPSQITIQKNKDCSLQLSPDNCVHTPKQIAETLPSIKLFKMKFQKYAEYFRLNEEERHKKIWSLENMSPEQKLALIDRIHFYEVYYQKYRKGLLSQKVNETEKTSTLSLRETKENHIIQSKDNTHRQSQSDVSQSIRFNASNSSETTCFVYMKKGISDNDNTDINETKDQENQEHCAVELTENQQDLQPESPQEHVDHHNGQLSKQSLKLGLSNTNPVDDSQTVQVDLEQVSLSCPSKEGKNNHNREHQSESSTSAVEDFTNESGPGVTLVERPHPELARMYANDFTAMDIASCVEVSSCGMTENSNSSSVPTERQDQNWKNDSNFHMSNCFSQVQCSDEIYAELNIVTLQENNSNHMELYKRLQLDQLFPSNGKQISSLRSYLTPRVMGGPTDTISKQINESEDNSKTEPQIMRCCKDLSVIDTPAHTTETLALSERFSKLKGCRTKATAFVNGTDFRNCKIIQNISSSDRYRETETCNVALIKLLAKRFNKTKLYVKCRSLSRPSIKACFLKKTLALRTKYIKKKLFWKGKKNVNTNMVPTDFSHEVLSKVTSDSLSHTSEIVSTCKDPEPDFNLKKMPHVSDADCERQQSHIRVSQEADAIEGLLQDHCCSIKSVISDDLTASLGSESNTESKEEGIKPTEPLSQDSLNTNIKKPTCDDPLNLISATVHEVEQVTTTINSSDEKKTSLITCDSNSDSSKDYESTITEEGSMSQEVTSEAQSHPLDRAELNNVRAVESLGLLNCDQVSDLHSEKTIGKSPSFSQPTKLLTNMSPDVRNNINEKVETGSETEALCNSGVDNIRKTNKTNARIKCAQKSQNMRIEEMVSTGQTIQQDKNQTCLTTPTNTSTNSKALSIDTEITGTNSQVDSSVASFEDGTSDSQLCGVQALKCASDSVVDLTDDNATSSGQCEIAFKHTEGNNRNMPVTISNTQHASTIMTNDSCHSSRPEQNQNSDVDSPETQLISKLRDYLTKFESTVKKQEAVNEDLKEKPVVWITLDSTAHKQQLAEKGQYSTKKVPEREHVQTGTDVYVLVPAESKKGRRSSQSRTTDRHKPKRARWSSCTSVSPDSTSVLDTVKDTSPEPLAQVNNSNAGEISLNNKPNAQIQMQSKETERQQNPIIGSQESVNMNGLCEQKWQANRSLDTIEIMDDGNVSSTFAESDYSVSDISNTLKMADQTRSLTELESLQSKCKKMLQQFILSFERDQKVPFNQCCVSRHLIIEQYLDHPPAHVDLKFDAVSSYLELQMMMEAWQFVENKINFLRGKPTFRSLLWYDPSLFGELYKGKVGFQQQSSLFTSFQKILVQEGYSKLQEYHTAVSTLHQQLVVDPDASYYMYLKSKRELLEIEAVLRNPRDIKSFFLSVPMAAMINFGDDLKSLENVYQVIMTFVETPSDQLPGTFDVGKAEHLSITCRYLQEKAFFIRSGKEMISKVSWFGIEHLLYDASKILIWQDMDHSVSNEVLKMYKSSNPQIIFGVTESGVTLVNKVEQPPQSMDGRKTPAEKPINAARKHKRLQIPMSSHPSDVQSINSENKVAYRVARKRASHPPITSCNMNSNGASPLFQTSPAAHAGNKTPFHAPPQKVNSVPWGMIGSTVSNWTAPNLVQPPPSTSHVHSEIKSLLLSKRRVALSQSEQRSSLAAMQEAQAAREQQWPSISALQTTSQDSCVTHPRPKSVKHQQSTHPHCPVPTKKPINQFTLAMTQPFSLPSFPLNATFVAPPSLSVQTLPNSLTHAPLPNMITSINYPYFLLNGQTYTTDSTAAINPYTRYHPNTI